MINFENLSPDMQSAIVSGLIGLLGAIIGALAAIASTWVAKKLQTTGKVSLFVKMVYSKSSVDKACGYYRCQNEAGLYLRIPLWLDIVNTSGISRIVRNVNLYAYSNKKEIATFTQIQGIGAGEKHISLGDNGAYTFVIPPNSACRFDVEFMLKETELSPDRKEFDEIVLSYFDEKNRIYAFHLMNIDSCWIVKQIPMEKQWIALNKRCRYGNYRETL
ncbi:hypothetical protein [Sporofaciens musculi]|jgi:hypothetical protein|uniref:hypothetical protein n=1 Tax=Sporofaciens musculi TaxID=2681861 RepID=UPI00259C926C|nr:hypothetical protein [Sporofaciens musculi]